MASRYAARSRVASSRNAREHFRATAVDLLRRLGRLRPVPTGLPHRYEAMLCEFVALQHDRSWLSDATCQSARWQITKFLDYLEQRGLVLETIHPADVKEVGDHLGHRDPDTTRIYAKVNLTMLRRVAFDDLGGLQLVGASSRLQCRRGSKIGSRTCLRVACCAQASPII